MEAKVDKVESEPVSTGILAKCVTYLSKLVDPLTSAGSAFASAVLATRMQTLLNVAQHRVQGEQQ